MDTIHYKVREDGRYVSKAFYTVLGVDLEGKKEILGLYLNESEGAKFWLQVLTDLRNRGVNDILIASVDGLTGLPEAINAVFPDTEVQLCIVHQIRNSLKYVASKDKKQFAGELKSVYQAFTKEAAETALDKYTTKYHRVSPRALLSEARLMFSKNCFFQFFRLTGSTSYLLAISLTVYS